MTSQRLSKLQRFVLNAVIEHGSATIEGRMIRRSDLVLHWCRAKNPGLYRYGWWPGDVSKTERNKLNASMTRSILNMRSKGLLRTFTSYHSEVTPKIGDRWQPNVGAVALTMAGVAALKLTSETAEKLTIRDIEGDREACAAEKAKLDALVERILHLQESYLTKRNDATNDLKQQLDQIDARTKQQTRETREKENGQRLPTLAPQTSLAVHQETWESNEQGRK